MSYQTKARKLLLDFLSSHPDNSYTADELAELLALEYGAGAAPGKSTVYRLVARLVEEALIKRFSKEGSRQAFYQIAGCSGAPHLHLKCMECGRLIHMEESVSDRLLNDILKSDHFSVDEHQTVLFGRCSGCRKQPQKGASHHGNHS